MRPFSFAFRPFCSANPAVRMRHMQIDDSHDFADFEHLNAYGAKKLTAYIGNMAVNQYGIKSDTAKSELSIWKKSVKRTKKALKMAREYTDRGEAQVVGEYEAAK